VRIFLRIEGEPGVLARVLAPFAVAGHAPHRLMLPPAGGGTAFVVADFDGPDVARTTLLAAPLRQLPCIVGARLSQKIAEVDNRPHSG